MDGAISDDARLAGYALAGLTVLLEKFRQHLAKQAVEAGEHLADADFADN